MRVSLRIAQSWLNNLGNMWNDLSVQMFWFFPFFITNWNVCTCLSALLLANLVKIYKYFFIWRDFTLDKKAFHVQMSFPVNKTWQNGLLCVLTDWIHHIYRHFHMLKSPHPINNWIVHTCAWTGVPMCAKCKGDTESCSWRLSRRCILWCNS